MVYIFRIYNSLDYSYTVELEVRLKSVNKIFIFWPKITMIKGYVVEYRFENVFMSESKRQRFSPTAQGFELAESAFKHGIKYIERYMSEDYESVSLYYQLDGGILRRVEHFDNYSGLAKPDYKRAFDDGWEDDSWLNI